MAAWPPLPSALAVASWTGGLTLWAVEPERGEVLVQSEPLMFSLFADSPPALVTDARGAFVAGASFGDADPTSGEVAVFVLDRDGAQTSRLAFPVHRGPDLPSSPPGLPDCRCSRFH